MRKLYIASIILVVNINAGLSQPTDNPYKTFYNNMTNYHWTDSLPWSSVTNAKNINGLLSSTSNPDSFLVNIEVYNQWAQDMSTSNGGILYFPTGKYYFADDLRLYSKVIIRGDASETPLAKSALFSPPTEFDFPKYTPGTVRSTAFKEVTADTLGISNSGMININLNRAVIGLYGGGWTKNLNGQNYTQYQPQYLHSNIIIMGVRHNNAAIPDPSSPSTNQMSYGATANSQAWPWRFGNNIDINVSQNCVVANCRLNDNPTDNFLQPNYILNDNKAIPNINNTEFNYLHHSGIDINRNKVLTRGAGYYASGPHGKHGLDGFVTYGTPEKEPLLFRPGIEIRDNWVKTLTRVKIKAAGIGLVIDNNLCTDDGGKIYYLSEDGTKVQGNNAATYENRGIDFSGWNCRVTRNYVFVQQGNIREPNKYQSVDGEAILVQECCGGTSVNDYYIADNVLADKSSGYIGLWKMRDLNNVVIARNNLGNKFIYAAADVGKDCGSSLSPPCYKLNGLVIDSNYNIKYAEFTGSAGGSACNNIISRNIFNPPAGPPAPQNNQNTAAIWGKGNVTVTNDNILNGRTVSYVPANGPSIDASGSLTLPTSDTLINSCNETDISLEVSIQCGTPDSVIFYKNTSSGTAKIGGGQLKDQVYSMTMTLPVLMPNTSVKEFITARIFSGGGTGVLLTNTIEIQKICFTTEIANSITGNAHIVIYPNPATNFLNITNANEGEELLIKNALGQTVGTYIAKNNLISVDISHLLSGVYIISIGSRQIKRFVKL